MYCFYSFLFHISSFVFFFFRVQFEQKFTQNSLEWQQSAESYASICGDFPILCKLCTACPSVSQALSRQDNVSTGECKKLCVHARLQPIYKRSEKRTTLTSMWKSILSNNNTNFPFSKRHTIKSECVQNILYSYSTSQSKESVKRFCCCRSYFSLPLLPYFLSLGRYIFLVFWYFFVLCILWMCVFFVFRLPLLFSLSLCVAVD